MCIAYNMGMCLEAENYKWFSVGLVVLKIKAQRAVCWIADFCETEMCCDG